MWKQFQLHQLLPWYSMDCTKPVQITFFRKFDGSYLWTGNRCKSEILFVHVSQLDLSIVKISASLNEVFGQGTLDKIRFFVKTRFSTSISLTPRTWIFTGVLYPERVKYGLQNDVERNLGRRKRALELVPLFEVRANILAGFWNEISWMNRARDLKF